MKLFITKSLIDFLNSSCYLSNSNIVLTDLKRIIFTSSDVEKHYLNSELSESIKQVLDSPYLNKSAYLHTTIDSIVPLVNNDNISKYKSQIILPIFHNDVADGLLVFFTEDREYLPSNLKFAETTRHFAELFSTKDYL